MHFIASEQTALFRSTYKKYFKKNPRIEEGLRTFLHLKTQIPSQPLPAAMKDHALKGDKKGLWECHLLSDVLLVYLRQQDMIKLLLVCNHDELFRRDTAKKLKRHL